MCGVSGIIDNSNNNLSTEKLVQKMNSVLRKRGPDNSEVLKFNHINFSLGHTRLSILDLSEKANQPMKSSSGRYYISYNGEIYNFKHLANKINIDNLNKNSDTKILVEFIEKFGLEKSLNSFSGMFAFALYDNKENKIFLARDRFGEKPLYYYKDEKFFVFASDINCFEELDFIKKRISKEAFDLYLSLSYIPAPYSIYENIYKIEPGEIVEVNLKNFNLNKRKWWTIETEINKQSKEKYNSSEIAIKDLDSKFNEVIPNYLLSDVPIGVFLSGGIDSTLISLYAQKHSNQKLNSFNIKFKDSDYDESIYSKKISDALNTNHNILEVNYKDNEEIFEKLNDIYQEPFADSSQIPTYLVSKFAKTKVTVCLSGDGGDELFGGYNRYLWIDKLWRYLSIFPLSLRNLILDFFKILPNKLKLVFVKIILSLIVKNSNYKQLEDKISKFISKFKNVATKDDIYYNLINQNIIYSSSTLNKFFKSNSSYNDKFNKLEESMTYMDSKYYLSNDILCKVDRASMYNSLETRIPFLDREIFEISQKIPISMKIKNGETKWILKKLLKGYLDESLFIRPKMGFSIPLGKILRNELKGVMNELIQENKIKHHNLFDFKKIKKIINEHCNLKEDHSSIIWNVLVFQNWYEKKKNYLSS